MKLAAKSRTEILAEARRQYQAAVASAPEPDLRNVEAVTDLDAALRFSFRGMLMIAAPTPYADGVAMVRWQARMRPLDGKSDPESCAEYSALLRDAVERFHRLARPVRPFDRLRWFGRNPFRAATEAEIGWLVGFFSACRMIARVRHGKRS